MRMLRWLAVFALALPCVAQTGLRLQPDGPTYSASGTTLMAYGSTCAVTVSTPASTPKSVFCPAATDPNSTTNRTYAANALTVGKSFRFDGGGTYTVPAANTVTANVTIAVGSSTVMTLTTPAAPVGTNAGIDFHAVCTVVTSTTISCQGLFSFVVVGATSAPVPFSQTSTFTPGVANLVDVLGTWNAGVTTQTTTVNVAAFQALN